MRSLWRTTIGLAAASVAMVTTLVTTSASASASAPPPPVNELAFANLALNQMLTRGTDGVAVTAFGWDTLPQIWDQLYQVQFPTQDGMSSPYLLRSHGTGLCLQDMGEGRPVLAVGCETDPAIASRQLWQIHRVPDYTTSNGRHYYYQINRTTGRVLSAQLGPEFTPVISAPAVPVSKSGAANHQLWVQLGQ